MTRIEIERFQKTGAAELTERVTVDSGEFPLPDSFLEKVVKQAGGESPSPDLEVTTAAQEPSSEPLPLDPALSTAQIQRALDMVHALSNSKDNVERHQADRFLVRWLHHLLSVAQSRDPHDHLQANRLAAFERDLEELGVFLSRRHPLGQIKHIGLREVCRAAKEVIETLEAKLRHFKPWMKAHPRQRDELQRSIEAALQDLGVDHASSRDANGRWSVGDLATDLADRLQAP